MSKRSRSMQSGASQVPSGYSSWSEYWFKTDPKNYWWSSGWAQKQVRDSLGPNVITHPTGGRSKTIYASRPLSPTMSSPALGIGTTLRRRRRSGGRQR